MFTLDEIILAPIGDVYDWLQTLSKEDKPALKQLNYELKIHRQRFMIKLLDLTKVIDMDEDNCKIRLKVNHVQKSLIPHSDRLISSIESKIASFDQGTYDKLSPAQRGKLLAFQEQLKIDYNGELPIELFISIKQALFNLRYKIKQYSIAKNQDGLSEDQRSLIRAQHRYACNVHNYKLCKLRILERHIEDGRVYQMAVLPNRLGLQVHAQKQVLTELDIEGLVDTKFQYEELLQSVQNAIISAKCQQQEIPEDNALAEVIAQDELRVIQLNVIIADLLLELKSRLLTYQADSFMTEVDIALPTMMGVAAQESSNGEEKAVFSHKTCSIKLTFSAEVSKNVDQAPGQFDSGLSFKAR